MSLQQSKRVFISGIAGFLGSHLAEALIAQGHEVMGCDNLSGGYFENVPSQAQFFEYDLRDWQKNMEHTKDVDIIYHTAALAYDGLSVFNPHLVTENVFNNSVSLMSAAIENGVQRFVYCSSMARYGNQSSPFTEDMHPRPTTPYGIAKYSAEMTLQNLCETHGMEYSICVPHSIIGPRQKYDDPYRNVAAIMMNRMLQGMQPVIYGDGSQKRCFSFVQDCIQTLSQMGFAPQAKNEIYNIGPDEEEVTVLQLAETIANEINFDLDPIFMPSRPNEVEHANCCAQKIREHFGYKTKYSLQRGISEMVHWVQQKGAKPFNYSFDIEIKNEKMPKTWRERIF